MRKAVRTFGISRQCVEAFFETSEVEKQDGGENQFFDPVQGVQKRRIGF
jgi:hypothetical protein